jgi:hypothetical protein
MKDKDRQHIGDRYVEIFLHQVGGSALPCATAVTVTRSSSSSSLTPPPQVGDTVYGQKFARGGRGGGGSEGGSFKHEGGAAEGVKMNSGDIFKKLSREVRARDKALREGVAAALRTVRRFGSRDCSRRLSKPVILLQMSKRACTSFRCAKLGV